LTTISTNLDNEILKEFRDVIYHKSGLKKGDFQESLEDAMVDYILKHSKLSLSKKFVNQITEENDVEFQKLVELAIKVVLLEIGKPELQRVIQGLEGYGTSISDCYKNPKYLYSILKELYGNQYSVVVDAIGKKLDESVGENPIGRFVNSLKYDYQNQV